MKLVIELRAEARRTKNFAIADKIRDGLAAFEITLEDRPDGTNWRTGGMTNRRSPKSKVQSPKSKCSARSILAILDHSV